MLFDHEQDCDPNSITKPPPFKEEPASGSKGNFKKYYLRKVAVFGLGDLFKAFGAKATAKQFV